MIAGTVGGWSQVVVGHPFDTIKVRLQTQGLGLAGKEFEGPVECFLRTVRQEGATGLFRGIGSPLLGVGICNATLFSANENFRRLLQWGDPQKTLSIAEMTVAGGLSGIVIALVICPIELVKVRLQVQTGAALEGGRIPYAGVTDCVRRLVQEGGMLGIYRGFHMTVLREVPSFAAYFENDRYPRTMDLLMAGGIAGQLGWISCYPQDVIKSRIQARENGPVRTYRTIREMWSGPGGGILGRVWWVGFGTTMIRAFPANAATFLAYERCMEWLRGSRGEWD
ncbi:MAG: mitochondrial carrier domain-containing protein [Piptocephalis tieghemiana]|nr:MAG: mitochondrial carrier domain-containing protein [Piptocephalis tieghemiana]